MGSVLGRLRLRNVFAIVMLVLAAFAVASAAPALATGSGSAAPQPANASGAWMQFGFLASGGRYNPFERVLSPANVAGLGVDWSYHTGRIDGSSAAVVNGVVYVGSDDFISASTGKFYAFNAKTGKLLWSFTTAGTPGDSSPAVANGVVYIGVRDTADPDGIHGHLYALHARTGRLLWSDASDQAVGTPTVANKVVYVGAGAEMSLNARTGEQLSSSRPDTWPRRRRSRTGGLLRRRRRQDRACGRCQDGWGAVVVRNRRRGRSDACGGERGGVHRLG